MADKQTRESLPKCAEEYIGLVAGEINYGRQLSAAFEAELRGLGDDDKAKKALDIISQLWQAERLRALILKGRKLSRPLWRKAIIWALYAICAALAGSVVFFLCLLLPMSLNTFPHLLIRVGVVIGLYLMARCWLRRRLALYARKVSWASEEIADKYGAFVMPKAARDYIALVARKVGYRRRVRAEVREELEGHFSDALAGIADKQERLERAAAVVNDFGNAGTLAKLIRRGKKRCRPVWLKALIRTCQAAGIAMVCLVAFVFWFFSGKPHITVDYVAELNRLEQPLADESLNAWVNYQQAFSMTVEEPEGIPYPWQYPLDPNQEAMIREWVAANDAALEEVLRGHEKPHRWRKYESRSGALIDILIPWLPQYRYLFYSMLWKARFAAEDGDMQTVILWLARAMESQSKILSRRFAVEQMVSFAFMTMTANMGQTILQRHEMSSRDMEAMQKLFQNRLAEFRFQFSFDFEKMFIEDTVQRTFTAVGLIAPEDTLRLVISLDPHSHISRFGMESMSLREVFVNSLLHGRVLFMTRGETLRDAQRFLDEIQKMLDMTPYETRKAGMDPRLVWESMRTRNPYLGILLGDWSRAWQSLYMSRATLEAFPVIIAAHRYKLDKGDWPASMDELQRTGYIKSLPMDPWSSGPLVYRKTDDGFTIYSFGPNFTDDGGVHVPWPTQSRPGRVYRDPEDFKGDLVYWPMPPAEKRR